MVTERTVVVSLCDEGEDLGSLFTPDNGPGGGQVHAFSLNPEVLVIWVW